MILNRVINLKWYVTKMLWKRLKTLRKRCENVARTLWNCCENDMDVRDVMNMLWKRLITLWSHENVRKTFFKKLTKNVLREMRRNNENNIEMSTKHNENVMKTFIRDYTDVLIMLLGHLAYISEYCKDETMLNETQSTLNAMSFW